MNVRHPSSNHLVGMTVRQYYALQSDPPNGRRCRTRLVQEIKSGLRQIEPCKRAIMPCRQQPRPARQCCAARGFGIVAVCRSRVAECFQLGLVQGPGLLTEFSVGRAWISGSVSAALPPTTAATLGSYPLPARRTSQNWRGETILSAPTAASRSNAASPVTNKSARLASASPSTSASAASTFTLRARHCRRPRTPRSRRNRQSQPNGRREA